MINRLPRDVVNCILDQLAEPTALALDAVTETDVVEMKSAAKSILALRQVDRRMAWMVDHWPRRAALLVPHLDHMAGELGLDESRFVRVQDLLRLPAVPPAFRAIAVVRSLQTWRQLPRATVGSDECKTCRLQTFLAKALSSVDDIEWVAFLPPVTRQSAFNQACAVGLQDLARTFMASGLVDLSQNGYLPFRFAVQNGHAALVRDLMEHVVVDNDTIVLAMRIAEACGHASVVDTINSSVPGLVATV